MKIGRLISAAVGASLIVVAGCSTTTTNLYPKGNSRFVAIAQSRNQSDAANAAIQKATKTCQELNKQLVVISNRTIYQGSGKDKGDLTEAISNVATATTGIFVHGTKTNADYKSTVNFACRNKG